MIACVHVPLPTNPWVYMSSWHWVYRSRYIKDVHPGTRVATIPEGGILCAAPDGVKVFNEGGSLLRQVVRTPGDRFRSSSTNWSGIGTWGSRRLTSITPVIRETWQSAFRRGRANDGGIGDFYPEAPC